MVDARKGHREDPYLVMRPERTLYETPKKAMEHLVPHFATVRLASEWNSLGLPVSIDEIGFPQKRKAQAYQFYGFQLVDESDPVIAEGIATGKKVECDPSFVFEYLFAGSDLRDFVTLPEDVRLFCEAMLLWKKGRQPEALPMLQRAADLQRDERRPAVHLRLYKETYYRLRLELHDLTCIDEELEFFEADIDSLVHTGRVDKWIEALAASNEFSHARLLVERVDVALKQLAEGTRKPRFYEEQRSDWYSNKREQFAKASKKYQVKGICEGCGKQSGIVSRIESGQWVCRSCLREIRG